MEIVRDIRFRIATLVLVGLAAIWFALGPTERLWFTNALSVLLAIAAPALVLGSAWAWIRLDTKAGVNVAGVVFVLTCGIIGAVVGRDIGSWFVTKTSSWDAWDNRGQSRSSPPADLSGTYYGIAPNKNLR